MRPTHCPASTPPTGLATKCSQEVPGRAAAHGACVSLPLRSRLLFPYSFLEQWAPGPMVGGPEPFSQRPAQGHQGKAGICLCCPDNGPIRGLKWPHCPACPLPRVQQVAAGGWGKLPASPEPGQREVGLWQLVPSCSRASQSLGGPFPEDHGGALTRAQKPTWGLPCLRLQEAAEGASALRLCRSP